MGEQNQTGKQVLERLRDNPIANRAHHDQLAMIWLGRTLRQAREKLGISQEKAAKLAGMTQAELSRVENALPVKGVTFTTLVGLSEALAFDIVFELHPRVAAVTMDATTELSRHLTVREIA